MSRCHAVNKRPAREADDRTPKRSTKKPKLDTQPIGEHAVDIASQRAAGAAELLSAPPSVTRLQKPQRQEPQRQEPQPQRRALAAPMTPVGWSRKARAKLLSTLVRRSKRGTSTPKSWPRAPHGRRHRREHGRRHRGKHGRRHGRQHGRRHRRKHGRRHGRKHGRRHGRKHGRAVGPPEDRRPTS